MVKTYADNFIESVYNIYYAILARTKSILKLKETLYWWTDTQRQLHIESVYSIYYAIVT